MLFKIIVVLLLLFIVGSLASGFVFILKDKGQSDRAVKALSWRIGLSLFAFALLMAGHYAGLITPHGISP
ncbi:MAG: twin transmembrane helix small protein [Gammaproteobacteria bacterium]